MTSEERDSLGSRIHVLRELVGLSLGELEKASGVSKGYLSQLERGEASNPSLEAVKKIARGLGVQVSELLGEIRESEGLPRRLPQGLKDFLALAEKRGTPLSEDDITMLLGIHYRGRQPRTAQDFALLYDVIKRIVG